MVASCLIGPRFRVFCACSPRVLSAGANQGIGNHSSTNNIGCRICMNSLGRQVSVRLYAQVLIDIDFDFNVDVDARVDV